MRRTSGGLTGSISCYLAIVGGVRGHHYRALPPLPFYLFLASRFLLFFLIV